jgi:hypothetical protein
VSGAAGTVSGTGTGTGAGAGGGAPDPWREPPAIFATLPIRGQAEELETADI